MLQVVVEVVVQLLSTTKQKVYAIIENNIVSRLWAASSIEEAQIDNPESVVVEVTEKNSPWHMNTVYDGRI